MPDRFEAREFIVTREELVSSGIPGPAGPQGASGPPGPEGGQSFVVHEQNNPVTSDIIDHGLGRLPIWYVVEQGTGDELEPGRDDPNTNQTIFDFDGIPTSFIAYGS